ncbi:MAG: hypothetical protein LBP95_03675 [Deltaproteobacteria bacterium]|jgi:lipopolysaccharide export system protein LptA|nr:hypothetical protein [Deltaproteobacteria bacterium]
MSQIFRHLLRAGLLLAVLGLVGPGAAAAADTPIGSSNGPISISADRMTADDNSRVVTFTGRVITRQDDMIITCDLMRVHYQPVGGNADAGSTPGIPAPPPSAARPTDGQAGAGSVPEPLDAPPAAETVDGGSPATPLDGGQEIYRIDCEGSVKIQQRDRLAVGQKALYLAKSEPRRLILTGDARVWENGNSVTGHQVVYYLDQNRSQVESRENQRVRAFLDEGGQRQ